MEPAAPSPTAPAVELVALSRWIDHRPILQDINLRIAAGEFVALLGANGAGKSTLLSIIATLVGPTSGQLSLFGRAARQQTSRLRMRIGMIGHQPILYRDLSVMQNLEFFGRLYGVRDVRSRAGQLLDEVELSHRADDPVKTLSRGMVQRVAIARALMHDPALLLADEPFTGLDAPSTATVEDLLRQLHAQGRTIILTNHEIEQSLRLARRAVVLHRGQLVVDAPADKVDPHRLLTEVMQK